MRMYTAWKKDLRLPDNLEVVLPAIRAERFDMNNDEITIKPFYDKEGHLYISYGDES